MLQNQFWQLCLELEAKGSLKNGTTVQRVDVVLSLRRSQVADQG